jgi:hypothetical protein
MILLVKLFNFEIDDGFFMNKSAVEFVFCGILIILFKNNKVFGVL